MNVDTLSDCSRKVLQGTKSLMRKVEDIRLIPVWVNPEHLVSTAKLLMAGHKVRMLAVLSGQDLVGTVTLDGVSCARDDTPVSEVLAPVEFSIPADTGIREAAEMFISHNVDAAPVVREERFVGVLTSQLLLQELKHSWDPLTGLPWSDRLRDWGADNLKQGREITILFFDVDDFGLYNKRFGHIVGDRVLKKVAEALSAGVDSDKDVLVRYGGDEFAIGTTRLRDEAEGLVNDLKTRVGGLFLEDTDEPVTLSAGIYGGKRSHERESVHYAATLDNLINLASKDALSKKRSTQQPLPLEKEAGTEQEPETAEEPKAPTLPEPKVVGVYTDENAPNSLTIVILNIGGTVVSGVQQRSGRTVLQSIAFATAKALQRVDKEAKYEVEEMLMVEDSAGDKFLSVSGRLGRGEKETPVSAIRKVESDLYQSAVLTTVQAFRTAP